MPAQRIHDLKTSRVTIGLDHEANERLGRVRVTARHVTDTETVRVALKTYFWVANVVGEGETLAVERDGRAEDVLTERIDLLVQGTRKTVRKLQLNLVEMDYERLQKAIGDGGFRSASALIQVALKVYEKIMEVTKGGEAPILLIKDGVRKETLLVFL